MIKQKTALEIVRGRVVSPEAQTRRNEARLIALQHTLTRVNPCSISFAREKKKHGYFYFSRSTEWCKFHDKAENCSGNSARKGSVS